MADPVALSLPEAMIRTLQDYLDGPLPTAIQAETDPVGDIAHITQGWERIGRDMHFPTVSIDAPIEGERVSSAPTPITITPAAPDSPTIDVYYHVGSAEIPLQLNVFAESPDQRSKVVHALEQALQGDVLEGAGLLQVDSSHYYNLPISYRREGPFFHIDSEATVGGDEWRAVGTVLAESHDIVRASLARFLDLSVDWRIHESVKIVSIDDVPSEIVTYFEP
jgi:hypothetical protein